MGHHCGHILQTVINRASHGQKCHVRNGLDSTHEPWAERCDVGCMPFTAMRSSSRNDAISAAFLSWVVFLNHKCFNSKLFYKLERSVQVKFDDCHVMCNWNLFARLSAASFTAAVSCSKASNSDCTASRESRAIRAKAMTDRVAGSTLFQRFAGRAGFGTGGFQRISPVTWGNLKLRWRFNCPFEPYYFLPYRFAGKPTHGAGATLNMTTPPFYTTSPCCAKSCRKSQCESPTVVGSTQSLRWPRCTKRSCRWKHPGAATD